MVVLSRLFLNNPDKTTKLTPLFPGCSPHLLILRMLSIWSFCQCCFFNNPDKTTKLTPLFPGCSPLLILRMLSIWSFCQCFFLNNPDKTTKPTKSTKLTSKSQPGRRVYPPVTHCTTCTTARAHAIAARTTLSNNSGRHVLKR